MTFFEGFFKHSLSLFQVRFEAAIANKKANRTASVRALHLVRHVSSAVTCFGGKVPTYQSVVRVL